VEQISDEELVVRAQAGEREAFDRLVERHYAPAQRVAAGMVASAEVARELAQEALLQAYLSLDRLRSAASFPSWLHGIVRNVCRSYLRERRMDWLPLEAGEALPDPADDPLQVLEERERGRAVLEAVEGLRAEDRAALLLFYFEERSLQETAELMGVTVGALKVRLHKARKRLRERLAPLYPERPAAVPKGPGRTTMVPVRIADVLQKETTGHCVAVLYDEAGKRALPVWIQGAEAMSIAIGLTEFPVARPMTFQFVASVLEATGARAEAVRIESLRENTYYAVVRLRTADGQRDVDARPSDALALAQWTGCPIHVAEAIMVTMAIPVPEGPQQVLAELGDGLASLVQAFNVS